MAEDLDVPFRRKEQPEEHFDGGRFAGAIRAEKAENFAAFHLEIDVIDGARFWAVPEILEDFGEAANDDDVLAGLSAACVCIEHTH